MNNNKAIKIQLIISSLLGALSIILGAFSAHALENLVQQQILPEHYFQVFEKAVKYQMYHAILLLVLSLFNYQKNQLVFQKSFFITLAGILLFSGSLYWISTQQIIHLAFPHFLFWITPLGGLLMITGWMLIPFEILKQK